MVLLTTLASIARAQTPLPTGPDPTLWGLCAPDPLAVEITRDTGAPEDAPLEFTADTAQSSPLAAVLTGSVELVRGDQQLRAPQVTLNRTERVVTAEGGIVYGDPTLAIRGESARIDMDSRFARFNNTQYYVAAYNAQGQAKRVESQYDQRLARLEGVTYSTCQRGDEFWTLRSDTIELDQLAGRGVARDVTFLLQDVPVAYFPYLSFPLTDERQSGFLSPRLGFSEDLGMDLRLPYYWNIAPDQDMTFAPRLISRRGLLLGLEYRFLNPWNRGELSFEWLPNDRDHNHEDRGSALVHFQAAPLPRVHTDLLYQSISDHQYLDDFGTGLDLLGDTELERHLEGFYYGRSWNLYAQLETFQDIDDPGEVTDVDDPYNRLPQIEFQSQWPVADSPLNLEFYGEAVHFDHPSHRRDTGQRLDLWPTLGLPLDWPFAYLYPRAG
ncbi:MAG: LPS assembly protein LptD, partial [Candidatus Competibacteraceae bacterium]|nr:LPS assembly protein LptD [Candidatus Competibacteraceae bacterium]